MLLGYLFEHSSTVLEYLAGNIYSRRDSNFYNGGEREGL
jgi:hypothetical protein